MRNARAVEVISIEAPTPARTIGKRVAKVSLSAMLIIMAAQAAWLEHELPPASLANIEISVTESAPVKTKGSSHEMTPLRPMRVDTALQALYPVPGAGVGDLLLDEKFPSLRDWIHPVTNSPELVPPQSGRHFGAPRPTLEVIRPECGEGHCGIDLDGPRGRPLVSVADGVVVRIERSELGLDGRSGRYVKIEHDDGTLTAYMHMDDIADGLQVGDHVEGGQYIGTLGATAVFEAAPHCHFSLEIPNHSGMQGDNTDTHYVDPAPFLARAHIVKVPDRRRAEKPAI
jgi:murein DD-endopeptidase MepM/ murein hydrolase activator NlpD